MFAIATPQTVTLTIPGDDGPSTLINFRSNGADTSRCVLEIVTPEGDTHRLTFNVRGQMVDAQFVDHDSAPEAPSGDAPASYMVNGVDTRAFNPYTYQPPVDADSASRPQAGFKAVNVTADEAKEHREIREKDEREAAERAKEMLEKHLNTDPNDETQRLEAGKRMDGSPQLNPDNEPMVPAPSSPLPGSPPPHPLDRPDPGKVNTTKDLAGA